MDKNKIIILALIVVIVALLVGMFIAMSNVSKQETKITLKNNITITEGDTLRIKLTNFKENSIPNQTVNITIMDKENFTDFHSLVTDVKGNLNFKMDKDPGKYKVTFSYGGNDEYEGCNMTKVITIKAKEVEEEIEEPVTQQSAESSSSSSISEDEGYWETSFDAPFEYHTEYDSKGGFRQYDRAGNLVGSSYDEDQDDIADYVPRRI